MIAQTSVLKMTDSNRSCSVERTIFYLMEWGGWVVLGGRAARWWGYNRNFLSKTPSLNDELTLSSSFFF